MKKLAPLALALMCALLTGCASVPATKLSINPTTGAVILESPKEIGISNMIATLPNGVQVQLQGYQSHNSVDVLAAVAAANAQSLAQIIEMLKTAKSASGGALLLP